MTLTAAQSESALAFEEHFRRFAPLLPPEQSDAFAVSLLDLQSAVFADAALIFRAAQERRERAA